MSQFIENPKDTHLLFNLIQYTCKSSYSMLNETMIEPLRENTNIMNLYKNNHTIESLNLTSLKELPQDTLGYQYANFVITNNLKNNFYPIMKRRNLASYIRNHLSATHDIWHIVCGYSTSIKDEAALQAFMLAQVQSPLSLVLLGGTFIYIATKSPDEMRATMDLVVFGYEQGKKATNLLGVNWLLLFSQPLNEVRRQLNVSVANSIKN